MNRRPYFVYTLLLANGLYYVGCTSNLTQRTYSHIHNRKGNVKALYDQLQPNLIEHYG